MAKDIPINRLKAIKILEAVAEKLGDEEIFNCRDGDTKWYEFRDMVTEIIDGEKGESKIRKLKLNTSRQRR